MNRNRPYNPSSSRPHTSGVRHRSYSATATEPCRPTACAGEHPCRAAIVHCSFYIVHCFTFSAKERDPETGYSYFGSRYYSSDLSIWLSVDPMAAKYPSLSPYVYCANNPVKLVDPNGEFPIKIHKELVSNAFKLNPVGDKTLRKIQYGNGIKADVFHAFRSSTHMDNMKGTKPIAEAFQKAMSDFQDNMQAGNYVDAGENLHTIADFYSHSNYVELYQGYAEKNGLSMDVEAIRPFSEMMNDENFMEYVNGEGGGLRTGKFPGLGDDSHKKMNMDSNKSFNGKKPYDENNNPTGPTRHDAAKIAAQKELNNIIKNE